MMGIVFFSLWEIWKHLCRLKFEGGTLDPRSVIQIVSHAIRDMNQQWSSKRQHTIWEGVVLERLNISVKAIAHRQGKWIGWSKPLLDTFKLNTDGSRKGAVATGGGLVRDSNGDMVVAFAVRFNHQDVLQAELDDLLQGLFLCTHHNIL